MGNRASNGLEPINAVDKGTASYKSCFHVTENEISSLGHLFKFGLDLGDTYFQHAILIIQSVDNVTPITGIAD